MIKRMDIYTADITQLFYNKYIRATDCYVYIYFFPP